MKTKTKKQNMISGNNYKLPSIAPESHFHSRANSMMMDYNTATDLQFAGIKSKKTNLHLKADLEDENETKLSTLMQKKGSMNLKQQYSTNLIERNVMESKYKSQLSNYKP